ncbi:MAG: PhnD/SsuA/transferrin family substrate-binding protein [Chloroflexota bacterium]|nr:PhnD/SsuA/transferrin family substrate-binding protein [Chloroflexota bacterium]
MQSLKFASGHAALLDDTCRTVIRYLGEHLALPVEFVDQIEWTERYRQLDAGKIDMAWICGAPYVRRMAQTTPTIELLAAPVWRGDRYQNQPVYYSDVIVHRDSPFHTFADLRGSTWVYNEPGSLSGYAIMADHLARLGETWAFFGDVFASGAHLQSLQRIVERQGDVTAIDSVVLEQHLKIHPHLAERLRTVAVLGPNPSMPWVVNRHVPAELRRHLRTLLIGMGEDAVGRVMLAQTPVQRFAPLANQDYDPIRRLLARADTVVPM